MSWKISDQAVEMALRRRGLFARLSMAGRLTLLYTLAAFGMMALVTLFQFWLLTHGLQRDDLHLVADRFHMLEATLKYHGDDLAILDDEMNLEGSSFKPSEPYAYYSRVMDEAGGTLIETPHMTDLLPSATFPAPVDAASVSHEAVRFWRASNGRAYYQLAVWAQNRDGRRRLVQVALDEWGEKALIGAYQRNAMLALALGTLLFAGVGVFIARRGMRPLRVISRIAEQITASQLDARIERRIDAAQWPSEIIPLVREFDRMLGRLEDSFARMSQYSSDLAHELRTPIQNLVGEAEVALARPRTAEEYRRILESSIEEYGRLTRMINQMLFLARAENPATHLIMSRFDGHEALQAVRDFYEAEAEERRITVSCEGKAAIRADPMLFRHAVSNLLSNALHHTPPGGQVKLALHPAAGGAVKVLVSDTGSGIAAEHLPVVFNRFYRVDKAGSARSLPGTGLGLAIVKSIMTLHGGTAAIVSAIGIGTTVVLQFPVSDTPQ